MRHRVCVVVGTRPEAIKLAPVIRALHDRRHAVECVVLATSQHREMLRQALDAFGLRADVDLDLMVDGQDHRQFTSRAMRALHESFESLQPAAVMVQGDTSTVAAAALIARACGILLVHVEAGLRSGSLSDPYPEELNRRIATWAADLHFAPTERARCQLLAEGIDPESVIVTGNTVVDALGSFPADGPLGNARLDALPWDTQPVLLATVHRRENYGARLGQICAALRTIVERHPAAHVVMPVHRNPQVRQRVHDALDGVARVHLTEPLSYPLLLRVLRRCRLVLSDSGGLQEEVPSFHKPILILRDRTERPEVLDAGFGRLVGASTETIVRETSRLLTDARLYAEMCSGRNPFGDGQAAGRIADALIARLGARRVAIAASRPA
ncbi:UDP-N-acetylglucosamine 2-epimerase [Gemmatirosa kalamazoonensis]|uniref:UDP-N-acetylglucosamine 2-epimerase (non-hydrolyzing) n=1 Tax=Gemmatirosa kalamazoonensis TaxID=861299 RepID=W0RMQ9_9BACT|nr:UDP-N-acetylglucosamine 2-epimerase (non-hydrolyzing) [Gemmatirosa kalamazoonensis]AHG91752.1 UDP-N-acetylglucosamine 2-epimerase [Gemmatirosa kalamazoonensis]